MSENVIRLGDLSEVATGKTVFRRDAEDVPRVLLQSYESCGLKRVMVVFNDKALEALGYPERVSLAVCDGPPGLFIFPSEDGNKISSYSSNRRKVQWTWRDVLNGLDFEFGTYLPAKTAEDKQGRRGLFVEARRH